MRAAAPLAPSRPPPCVDALGARPRLGARFSRRAVVRAGAASPVRRRGLYNNSLNGTMPSAICNLIIVGQLNDCQLQNISFVCPLPPCASKCGATCK